MRTLLAALSLAVLLSPVFIFAANEVQPQLGGVDTKVPGDPFGNSNDPNAILTRLDTIANWLFAILIAFAIIHVILAAFTYLTSGGGEGVHNAHKKLLYAAVAVAVAVLAKGIVTVTRVIVTNQSVPTSAGSR